MNFFKVTGYLIFIALIACASCNKEPNCEDGKQNFGERGIDCSGPCPNKCDCFDGISNFGEEGIDCGGAFCKPCTSCQDGLKNGDETEIDCGGGNCPPCEVDCPEDLDDVVTYTIDNTDFQTDSSPSAIISNENCVLMLTMKNADGAGVFQISQTKPGFEVGNYDIKNRSVTFMFIRHNNDNYYSSIDGAEGFFEITEFVNETDCKYFNASFNVVLTNEERDSKINMAGVLSEIAFREQE